MAFPRTLAALAALAVLAVAPPPLAAQHEDHAGTDGHRTFGHGHSLLLSAPLRGAHAVPAVATDAGGTGAFVLTGEDGRFELRYSLSWNGLANPRVVGVELRNYGAGGNGEVVRGLCGAHSTTACPTGRGATLAGVWTSDDRQPLTGELVSELAAGRIYAVVRTARHRQGGEIRGQLSGQPFMAHAQSFVVRFGHDWEGGPEVEAGAGGTGAFHLVAIGDGREILLYDLTVVGADGPVTGFSIVPGGMAKAAAAALAVRARGEASGSLSGQLGEVDPARAKSVGTEALTSAVLADGWVVVTTADGEVRGKIEVLQ